MSIHNHKNKVLFIASFPPPYHGGNVDNYHIAEYWNSTTSLLICFNISNVKRRGLTIGKLTVNNILNNIFNIARYVVHLSLHRSYDVILMNLAQGKWGFLRDSLFILISKFFSQKIICRFPGGDFKLFYSNSHLQFYIRFVLQHIDLVITEGKTVNSQFLEINKSIKVQNVRIGIPDYYKNNSHRKLEHFEILYICNHRKEKGFWDVLSSVKSIIGKNKNIHFNFVGELRFNAEEKTYIRKYIQIEKLNNSLKFSGTLLGEEKWKAYRNATIQILPSFSEGLPTSIIEGLSFGLPIIASCVGVIPEIIIECVNGFLIKPGDKYTLIDRILQLATDEELVRKISTYNRQYFLEEFTIEKFCRKLDHAILSVV